MECDAPLSLYAGLHPIRLSSAWSYEGGAVGTSYYYKDNDIVKNAA
jgi:hypothetical protein